MQYIFGLPIVRNAHTHQEKRRILRRTMIKSVEQRKKIGWSRAYEVYAAHNAHWFNDESSTCSKLMRLHRCFVLHTLVVVGTYVYIRQCTRKYFTFLSRIFFPVIFSIIDVCLCVYFIFHKLLLMIFYSWQHVATGIIINFHALWAVKRLSVEWMRTIFNVLQTKTTGKHIASVDEN